MNMANDKAQSANQMTSSAATPGRLTIRGEPGDAGVAAQIAALIEQAQSIAITGHERPDGDCIGSETALCSILRALGKNARIINSDPTPAKHTHLDADRAIEVHTDGKAFGVDLVFVLDSTDLGRIGRIKRADFGAAKVVDIDHHQGNPMFGDVNFVDTRASAVGELIARLAAELKWPVPPAAQLSLYTALVADTGHFAYSNTTPRVLRMAAELLELGVNGEAVWRNIYLNKTHAELSLEARARSSLECHAGGKICLIALRHSDFVETGTTSQSADEFSGIPRSLTGVELALFFYEVKNGAATKVSARSTKNVDACKLTGVFGGGGHRQAAGCTLEMKLDDAKATFLEAAIKAVGGGDDRAGCGV